MVEQLLTAFSLPCNQERVRLVIATFADFGGFSDEIDEMYCEHDEN